MVEIKIPNYLGTTITSNGKSLPFCRTKLKLHPEAVGQGFAILGKRGKGKSILAADMMEIFASRGQSFVVLDPPDAHWGIRYKTDAEGKPTGSSGLEVLLVGGEHGDVPLDPRGGKDLANTIVDGDISAVISMKALGFTERQRFCADFAEELFRINKTPRHIFFEEAPNFTPQTLKFEEQKRVLYAMEKLIDEGRGMGLGFSLISQRPALINKNVLEQTDNMFALGMIGPNDLDQMKNWFKHHIRDKEKLEHFVDDLAKMKQGECWFLSPEWLDEIVKFNVRYRVTYHAGRTPKAGERPVNVSKFSVGQAVERLRKLFADKKVERAAEVKDLDEAKKEIKRLELELKKQPKALTVAPAKATKVKISKADIREVVKEETERYIGYTKSVERVKNQLEVILEQWPPPVIKLDEVVASKLNLQNQKQEPIQRIGIVPSAIEGYKTVGLIPRDLPPNHLGSGARRLLAAVAGWPDGMKEGQWRAHAGLKKSGTFDTYKSRLRSAGLIEFRGDLVFATKAGLDFIGTAKHQAPRNTSEVVEIWRPKLGTGAFRIFETLFSEYMRSQEGMSVADLKQAAGFAERSGTFDTYMSRLKTARLIKSENKLVSLDKETLLL